MSEKKISRHLVTDAMDVVNVDGDRLREEYDGRGCYRGPCFGITLDNVSEALEFMTALAFSAADADHDEDENGYPSEGQQSITVGRLARAATVDSMGTGIILYFRGWSLEG